MSEYPPLPTHIVNRTAGTKYTDNKKRKCIWDGKNKSFFTHTELELMKKISDYVKLSGVEILTTKGLRNLDLYNDCCAYSITMSDLQQKFNYKEIMRENYESDIKQSLKKIVEKYGAIVLTKKWLKENKHRLINHENKPFTYATPNSRHNIQFTFCSITHIQSTNKQFTFENLAIEFKVIDEWNLKVRHRDKLSDSAKKNAAAVLVNETKTQLRKLYDTEGIGIKVLNGKYLSKNHNKISNICNNNKITLHDIAEEWGILEEYKKHIKLSMCESANITMRTPEWHDTKAKEILAEHGYFPTQEFLRANGEGSFVMYTYDLGLDWQQLHEKYNIPLDSKRLARNNFYMDSHAEVCIVNFLLCRDIEVKKGESYKNEYTQNTGRKGTYDLHFKGTNGIYKDTWMSVEIWGGKLKKHQEAYNKKRKEKEESHTNDDSFLGIEYQDCYDESKLINKLEPYIGVIEPFIFKNEEDKRICCTKWNLIDSIRNGCNYIMENNKGEIPSICWMRRSAKIWKDRTREDWEITENFDIREFCYTIKRFGGIRNARNLMKIGEQSIIYWNKESIANFVNKIYTLYKLFPNDIFRKNRLKTTTTKTTITEDENRHIKSLYYFWSNNTGKQNKQLYEEACNKCIQ